MFLPWNAQDHLFRYFLCFPSFPLRSCFTYFTVFLFSLFFTMLLPTLFSHFPSFSLLSCFLCVTIFPLFNYDPASLISLFSHFSTTFPLSFFHHFFPLFFPSAPASLQGKMQLSQLKSPS